MSDFLISPGYMLWPLTRGQVEQLVTTKLK